MPRETFPEQGELPASLTVNLGASETHIYNLADIIADSRYRSLTVFDEEPSDSIIERQTASVDTIAREDGKEATRWQGIIEIDHSDIGKYWFFSLQRGLFNRQVKDSISGAKRIEVESGKGPVTTPYSSGGPWPEHRPISAEIVVDGYRFVLETNYTDRVLITNHILHNNEVDKGRYIYGSRGTPKGKRTPFEYRLDPEPLESVDQQSLATAFAKTFMFVHSFCEAVDKLVPPSKKILVPGRKMQLGQFVMREIGHRDRTRTDYGYTLPPSRTPQLFNFKHPRPTSPRPAEPIIPSTPPSFSAPPAHRPFEEDQPGNKGTEARQTRTKREENKPEWHSSQYVSEVVEEVEPEYSLDDVGGLEDAKQTIRDIALAFNNPKLMAKWNVEKPKGILFYGEPGTGKTMLAHALAYETESSLWLVDSASLYDMWLSLSSKNVKEMFNRIRDYEGRLVVLFDEIDSIISAPVQGPGSGGAGSERNQVAGIFKQELNTLVNDNPDVLIAATTNDLDRIDPAVIRSGRFDYKIYIPLPDLAGRGQIIATILERAIHDSRDDVDLLYATDLNVPGIANATEGFNGADIKEIFDRVGRKKAAREARSGKLDPVTDADVHEAIRELREFG